MKLAPSGPPRRTRSTLGLIALTLFLAQPPLSASATSTRVELIASAEPGWPQWRGPRRDGNSDETGLLSRWPEQGPPLVWKAGELGKGYSSPIISGGRVFITGDVGQDLVVTALDLQGKVVWRTPNGRAWFRPYPGARATCTLSDGRIYHLNAHGRVTCLDAASGTEQWAANVFERFGGNNITWALSEGLLVHNGKVFITVGGTRALMAALDARTGATVWASEPLRLGPAHAAAPAHQRLPEPADEIDGAGYSSAILARVGDVPMIVGCSQRHAFGVDARDGRLLWTRPMKTRYDVIAATPVWIGGDGFFFTAPDGPGGRVYQLANRADGLQIREGWQTDLDTCQGGLVYFNGGLYGSRYRGPKGWLGLNAATGEVRHETRELAMGSVIQAEGRLYCLSQEGEVALLRPVAGGFEFDGRFRLTPERKNDVWAHPVILDGRLYLRIDEALHCFDVRDPGRTR